MIIFIIICLTVWKFHHKHCPEIQSESFQDPLFYTIALSTGFAFLLHRHILSRVSSMFYLTVFSFICPMPSVCITHSESSYACQNSQHTSGMAKQFEFFYPSAVCRSYNCHLSLKSKYSQYAIRFDASDCLSLM